MANNLQLTVLQCNGVTKKGRGQRCSRNGKHVHVGYNYCAQHMRIVAGVEAVAAATGAVQGRRRQPGASTGPKHVILIESRSEPCVVCDEALLDKPIASTSCGHLFHTECLRTWQSTSCDAASTCPTCRRRVCTLRKCTSGAAATRNLIVAVKA